MKSKKPRIVAFCGSRGYDNSARVHRFLFKMHEKKPIDILIHGDCDTGADKFASAWCKVAPGVQEVKVPAHWTKYGRPGPAKSNPAGPIRNIAILLLNPSLVIAFPGGKGTDGMVKLARKAGIKVKIIKA